MYGSKREQKQGEKMMSEDFNIKYIECACTSTDHVIRFAYDKYHKEIFTEVQLYQYNSLIKRMWLAFKYVLGFQCKYGHWDCTILGPNQVEELLKLLLTFKIEHNLNESSAAKIKQALEEIGRGKSNPVYTKVK